jgi:hypothetical protein
VISLSAYNHRTRTVTPPAAVHATRLAVKYFVSATVSPPSLRTVTSAAAISNPLTGAVRRHCSSTSRLSTMRARYTFSAAVPSVPS